MISSTNSILQDQYFPVVVIMPLQFNYGFYYFLFFYYYYFTNSNLKILLRHITESANEKKERKKERNGWL